MNKSIAQLTQERINGLHMMRDGALERLEDADLAFSPGGDNLTLGQLLKEFGDIEYSYSQSLKTLQHDWNYKNDTEGLHTDLIQMQHWFKQLDQQMVQQLEQITEADLQKQVDRTNGLMRTIEQQLEIYIQAGLIFLGKLVIYFRAMQKPLPPSISHYIG